MVDKKIVAVVGATGSPGGGLARALLADQDRRATACAVTTNISSPTATNLAATGAEVVATDLDDEVRVASTFESALVLRLPIADAMPAGIAAEDIGHTAYGAFAAGQERVGRTASITGTHRTGAQAAEQFGEAVTDPPPAFDPLRAAGQDEMANRFPFSAEAAPRFTAERDLDLVRRPNPQVLSLRQWVTAHAGEFAR